MKSDTNKTASNNRVWADEADQSDHHMGQSITDDEVFTRTNTYADLPKSNNVAVGKIKPIESEKSKNLVYVKSGTKGSIIKYMAHNSEDFESSFKKQFGSPMSIKFIHRHHVLLVDCINDAHKNKLLNTTIIGDLRVITSRPKFEQSSLGNQPRSQTRKCVIKGVPFRWTDEEIQNYTHADKAKRFLRPNNGDTNDLLPTATVLLEFTTDAPDTVRLGYTEYKTVNYFPKPMRCKNCYLLNHTEKTCRNEKPSCKRCGLKTHPTENCTNTYPVCLNCKGEHNADSNKCPKYLESQAALKLRSKGTFTYAQALQRVRTNKTTREQQSNAQQRNLPSTNVEVDEAEPREVNDIHTSHHEERVHAEQQAQPLPQRNPRRRGSRRHGRLSSRVDGSRASTSAADDGLQPRNGNSTTQKTVTIAQTPPLSLPALSQGEIDRVVQATAITEHISRPISPAPQPVTMRHVASATETSIRTDENMQFKAQTMKHLSILSNAIYYLLVDPRSPSTPQQVESLREIITVLQDLEVDVKWHIHELERRKLMLQYGNNYFPSYPGLQYSGWTFPPTVSFQHQPTTDNGHHPTFWGTAQASQVDAIGTNNG